MSHARPQTEPNLLGTALRRLVDLVSHRSGAVFALMDGASVTLPQLLLISRVERHGSASLSDLAKGSHTSAAAASQMIERLVQQGWLQRAEDPVDRRRKAIAVTPRAQTLLREIEAARSTDYELGLSAVSPVLRAQMVALLEQVVADIERTKKGDGQ